MSNLFLATEAATEAAAQPGYDFFGNLFKKVAEFSTVTWIVVAALVVLAALILFVSRNKVKWSSRMLAYGALCIALSFVLSAVRLYRMPQGGSVTPAGMLPIMLFSYSFGVAPGLLAGAAFGLLDFLQDGYVIAPIQFVLDYIIAYAMCGLAGVLRGRVKKGANERVAFGVGVVLGSFMRFACAVASGVIFFSEYAEGSGYSPLVYSIVYNGSYMLPNMLICLVLGVLIAPQLCRMIRRSA
ncbi:MAG: energy-coupled thiamine transporter ThiT [Eubacteriales bacterium]|nr:energy-coupled thiamine transporter ThiT [Eubacteriales bacterium]